KVAFRLNPRSVVAVPYRRERASSRPLILRVPRYRRINRSWSSLLRVVIIDSRGRESPNALEVRGIGTAEGILRPSGQGTVAGRQSVGAVADPYHQKSQ